MEETKQSFTDADVFVPRSAPIEEEMCKYNVLCHANFRVIFFVLSANTIIVYITLISQYFPLNLLKRNVLNIVPYNLQFVILL